MENFNHFLIRLQKFDVKTLKDVLPIPGYGMDVPLGEREYGVHYNIKHEVPEYNQKFRSQMEELMEMAMTDLLNLDIHRINFHLKRLFEIDGNILETLEKYNEIIVDPRKGNIERRRDVFSLQLERKFNVVGLDRGESSTRIPSDFLLDISLALGYRSVCIRKFIREVNDIIQTDEKKQMIKAYPITKRDGTGASMSGSIKPKQNSEEETVPLSKPPIYPKRRIFENQCSIFKSRTSDEFFNIIKDYFSGDQQEPLYSLLYKNKAPRTPLLFKGRGNQLADAFKQVYGANLIPGYQKIELEEWIAKYFRFTYKEMPKDYTKRYLNGIISTPEDKCKSPIINVKRGSDGNFHIFQI